MKTITLDDATAAALAAALQAAGTAQPAPTPVPTPTVPPGVQIANLPFETTVGVHTLKVPVDGVLAVRFTVPADQPLTGKGGKQCSISSVPTGMNDYTQRRYCLSSVPGDFTGIGVRNGVITNTADTNRAYFAIGPAIDKYGRPIAIPELTPGSTYYLNVQQLAAGQSAQVNVSMIAA